MYRKSHKTAPICFISLMDFHLYCFSGKIKNSLKLYVAGWSATVSPKSWNMWYILELWFHFIWLWRLIIIIYESSFIKLFSIGTFAKEILISMLRDHIMSDSISANLHPRENQWSKFRDLMTLVKQGNGVFRYLKFIYTHLTSNRQQSKRIENLIEVVEGCS